MYVARGSVTVPNAYSRSSTVAQCNLTINRWCKLLYEMNLKIVMIGHGLSEQKPLLQVQAYRPLDGNYYMTLVGFIEDASLEQIMRDFANTMVLV
jgi:hypothetical protein